MNRGDLPKPEPAVKVPGATPDNGATRRNFMLATGAAGAALALGPPQLAHANADQEWVLVEDFEVYDPEFEYRFFDVDDIPAVWEHADMDEDEDPEYDYFDVEKFDDGTRVVWVRTLPAEKFDKDFVYLNLDDSEVEWEPAAVRVGSRCGNEPGAIAAYIQEVLPGDCHGLERERHRTRACTVPAYRACTRWKNYRG